MVDQILERQEKLRIGVMLCGCGGKISDVIDLNQLRPGVSNLPGVVFVHSEDFPCSKDGLLRLQASIGEHELDRVLIAGCTPRLMEKHFQKVVAGAGLEPEYVEIADIREHCAYVHADADQQEAVLEKALDQIAMGAARLTALRTPQMRVGQINKRVLIAGSSLEGLAAALSLAENGIQVLLVEREDQLGSRVNILQDGSGEIMRDQIAKIRQSTLISEHCCAKIARISGAPGDYKVLLHKGDEDIHESVGAIIIATGAYPQRLNGNRWYDRSRTFTQAEFEEELDELQQTGDIPPAQKIVMLLDHSPQIAPHLPGMEKRKALIQALEIKRLNPEVEVSILLQRDQFDGEKEALRNYHLAQEAGVKFYRFSEQNLPKLSKTSAEVYDLETGKKLELPFDRLIISMPVTPGQDLASLAALLHLPRDEQGFVHKPRRRLRPERFVEDAIFILGGAEKSGDTREALLQAYLTTSRVLHFLKPHQIELHSPVAEVDNDLCTGCGTCVQSCPVSAIDMVKREGLLSLAEINLLRCTGCGTCAVVCPVKAINIAGWGDDEILAQINAALMPAVEGEPVQKQPRIIAFTCEWGAYAAADLAGVQHIAYPSNLRVIRMNCSARFDPFHVLWAFLRGADGVFLGACPPGECHQGESNLKALERMQALRAQLESYGFAAERLHFDYIPGDDPAAFVRSVEEFSGRLFRQPV